MAQWWLSNTGPGTWFVWGGGITNHEAFAFAPDPSVGEDVGLSVTITAAYNSQSAVWINGVLEPLTQTNYVVTITPVDSNLNTLDNQAWSGTLNSNQV
jgi:hypothetical protein